MNKTKPISLIIIILLFYSCSTEEKKISTIKELDQNQELITTYNEAYKALELGDPYFAAQKFLEAELLYPQSEWAAKSALMASYSYYMQNFYPEALSNLERYLKTYPSDANIAYAHYLMAICYYETIEDEKRDIAPLLNARSKFNYILENYPNTDFALDSKFKLDLINDILAAKEMYLGRHYVKKTKWIAAINRFKTVIDDYDQSIFAEEALHRLVEIYYKLGLIEESEKYASVLGYNYLSSEWYKKTYKIFNQDYDSKAVKTLTKDKKGVFNKFKKLFE
jgi:outer membrane protein assembly factor BamD